MFEVFLSYNNVDKVNVSRIASKLHDLGVAVWFDEWVLVPGTPWQPALISGIDSSHSVAVCIGPSGVGPWENAEMMFALDRALRDSSFRVIPVLLPGAPAHERLALPKFLNLFSWVDFRRGLDDSQSLRRLISGIRGQAPGIPDPAVSQFNIETTAVHATKSPLARYIESTSLLECFAGLGILKEWSQQIVSWLEREAAESLKQGRATHALNSFSDYLDRIALEERAKEAARAFIDEWVTSLIPSRLLQSSFYLSQDKVTRTYRAYRPTIERHYLEFYKSEPKNYSAEDKFGAIHGLFFDTGNLVFLPARVLLEKTMLLSSDPVFYFTGIFMLDSEEELFSAFPRTKEARADSNRVTVGLANEVFQHPDPFLHPYINLSGYLGKSFARMTVSRKYVSVDSMTVNKLFYLLKGDPVVMSGIGGIEMRDTGEYIIQPLVCRFSGDQGWLQPIRREGGT